MSTHLILCKNVDPHRFNFRHIDGVSPGSLTQSSFTDWKDKLKEESDAPDQVYFLRDFPEYVEGKRKGDIKY